MAEYFPLISRAVAGLRDGKPEVRRAIYDRARQALVGQLRAMDPPVPEEAIARETAALDDAIARAEAEITGTGETTAPLPQPSSANASTRLAPDAAPKPTRAAPAPAAPALGGAKRTEEPRPDTSPVPRPQAPAPLLRTPASPRSASRAAGADKPGASLSGTGPVEGKRPEPAVSARPATPALPAAPVLRVEPVTDQTDAVSEPSTADRNTHVRPDDDEPLAEQSADKGKDDGTRPAAPRPAEEKRSGLRVWIVAVAALAAVVAIAITAWRLRDNPQELTRTPAPQTAQTTPDKIVERADDGGSGSAPAETAAAPVATDEAARNAKEAAPASGIPGAPQTGNANPSAAAGQQTQAEALLPIAYKAAILIDAPDTPEKVKTYVGTVVWHAQNVATGQGQPISLAIQADVSIPEANTQLSMQIRRNTEPQLPASHTIDLKFTIAAGSPLGSIKQVNVPQMRQQDMPTGDPLAGIPVTIADNYFLIGLMRGAAEDRNLELLRSRQWIDIPLLLANGKASKITFEKGANGERIFNDVLSSWKTAPN